MVAEPKSRIHYTSKHLSGVDKSDCWKTILNRLYLMYILIKMNICCVILISYKIHELVKKFCELNLKVFEKIINMIFQQLSEFKQET